MSWFLAGKHAREFEFASLVAGGFANGNRRLVLALRLSQHVVTVGPSCDLRQVRDAYDLSRARQTADTRTEASRSRRRCRRRSRRKPARGSSRASRARRPARATRATARRPRRRERASATVRRSWRRRGTRCARRRRPRSARAVRASPQTFRRPARGRKLRPHRPNERRAAFFRSDVERCSRGREFARVPFRLAPADPPHGRSRPSYASTIARASVAWSRNALDDCRRAFA